MGYFAKWFMVFKSCNLIYYTEINLRFFKKFAFIILIIFLFIQYTKPIDCPDLFWQMKYGEYIVKNHTLRPDHTIYSWTNVDPNWTYCAWISEVLLYILYKIGGFTTLFILKYLVLFFIIGLLLYFNHKLIQTISGLAFLSLLLVGITIQYGMYIKPEIFSLVFFSIIVFLYFYSKTQHKSLFFIYPLIFLIWVNTHGGFIFGLIFITIIFIGEIINFYFSPTYVKKIPLFYLFLILITCYTVLFINPYGYQYFVSLYRYATDPLYVSHTKAVLAYKGVIKGQWGYLLIIMIITFILLFLYHFIKSRKVDIGLLLLNITFFIISIKYRRSSYFYPIIWYFSIFYLTSQIKFSQKTNWYIILASLFSFFIIGTWSVYFAIYYPRFGTRFGYGISYYFPEKEATFIKKCKLEGPIFNTYGIGGYLAWRIYPEYKVFIDGRFGPYASVFPKYRRFELGYDFTKFTQKYKFKTAVVELKFQKLLTNFINSDMWKLAYFDKSSAIFVYKSLPLKNKEDLTPRRFENVKNMGILRNLFAFYLNKKDIEGSSYILELMKRRFYYGKYKRYINDNALLLEAYLAFKDGHYEKAINNLEYLKDKGTIKDISLLVESYYLTAMRAFEKDDFSEALIYIERILPIQPNHPDALYYAGLLSYFKGDKVKTLKYFRKFISLYPDNPLVAEIKQILIHYNIENSPEE